MPAPMCPDKPFHTWMATCLLFLHLGARTSPVPPTYRATCLLFLHLSAQTSPVATQRAVCFTFLHPCARTSPVTHGGLRACYSCTYSYVPRQARSPHRGLRAQNSLLVHRKRLGSAKESQELAIQCVLLSHSSPVIAGVISLCYC